MAPIRVEGMSCGHCAANVTKAITAIDPGAKVQVDVPAGEVRVDTAADEVQVREAIRRAGYRPVA